MALFEKTDPTGIDKPIQRLQGLIYSGLGYPNINGFGRAYVIEKDQKKLPVRYIDGSKTDYEEILFNDEVNGHFFFLDKNETTPIGGGTFETDIEIIFFINIEKLKPNVTHRADEEIRSEIVELITRFKFFKLKNIIKGPEALDGFDTDLKEIQPRFFLKVTGTLKYQFNC